ncbi:MAG: AmmeMemoRadiSam system protein B [Anaerolineaceae bacterium]|nr:AmmeMemoRadiSam system protein B [Anaerolineaceae bacterium]
MKQSFSAVRPSPIAGSWYPGNATVLRSEVSRYLDSARLPALPGPVLGVISPHAGYHYSGPTAGYAYRAVQGQSYDLVVVASPLHDYLPYPFLTSAHQSYATPLGEIEVETDLLQQLNEKLQKRSGEHLTAIANDHEHSLEIQLPFLQTALSQPFRLLPLMVREQNPAALQEMGEVLAEIVAGQHLLLVASTDLSHFYPEEEANLLDATMMAQFAAFSPQGVLQAEASQTGFACGSGAVAVILWAAKALGGKQVTLLHHSTSGKTSGDHERVVGYGAAAITQ